MINISNIETLADEIDKETKYQFGKNVRVTMSMSVHTQYLSRYDRARVIQDMSTLGWPLQKIDGRGRALFFKADTRRSVSVFV